MPHIRTKKRCCRWQSMLILFLLLLIAGLLIAFLVPRETWDTVKNGIPGLGADEDDGKGGKDKNGSTTSPPTPAPTTTPLFTYDFIQCDDVNNCCNGLEEICGLGVDEILWATSHNSMATREGGFLFGPNHLYNLEQSLEAGYRALNLDVCNCGGEYQLCHGVCTLGARDPVEVFQNIVSFLNDNPSEVVIINLQVNNEAQGGSDVSITDFSTLLSQNVPGLDGKLYNHSSQTWPTLQTLVDSDDRILLFHFNGPTCNDIVCPSGWHYWFDYAAETRFSFEGLSDFDDATAACEVTRGAGSTKQFFAVTNFVTPPNQDVAAQLNTMESLERRLLVCSAFQGLDVNLLYVDFWTVGDLPEFVQTINKERAAQRRHRDRKLLR